MHENAYWLLRLITSGVIIGAFGAYMISTEVGLAWLFGYTLCWTFSFNYVNQLRKEVKDGN